MSKGRARNDDSGTLDTKVLFAPHEWCWWFLGQKPGDYKRYHRTLYNVYSWLINIFFAIAFPLHLMMGVFVIDSATDMFRNLTVLFTTALATTKSYIIWWNFQRHDEIQLLIYELDKRIVDPIDVSYFKHNVHRPMKRITLLFYFLCIGSGVTSETAVVVTGLLGNWQLMYPMYLLFDPYSSMLRYSVAHFYGVVGVIVHLLQNFVNDTYGCMCIAYLAGHVRLLGRRLTRIGWDRNKSSEVNNEELLECIAEHKLVKTFHHKLVDLVSKIIFLQMFFTAVNMCMVIVFMLFYVEDVFNFIYYSIYLLAMAMEIFPCCFYGSKLQREFENLTYNIFGCNWMIQNREFKSNIRILIEQTIRPVHLVAGGIFRINLAAFLETCKMAYSLFTVISQMK